MAEALSREALHAFLEKVPYARSMGFELSWEDGQVTVKLPIREDLVGNAQLRAVHGGLVGALMEFACIAQVLHEAGDCQPRIVNITVDYLRGARSRTTYARAQILRLGRQIASVRAIAWQDDPARPVSAAKAQFLFKQSEAT